MPVNSSTLYLMKEPRHPANGVQNVGGSSYKHGTPDGVQTVGGSDYKPGTPDGVHTAGGSDYKPGTPSGVQNPILMTR